MKAAWISHVKTHKRESSQGEDGSYVCRTERCRARFTSFGLLVQHRADRTNCENAVRTSLPAAVESPADCATAPPGSVSGESVLRADCSTTRQAVVFQLQILSWFIAVWWIRTDFMLFKHTYMEIIF